jgi:hypothetical protein
VSGNVFVNLSVPFAASRLVLSFTGNEETHFVVGGANFDTVIDTKYSTRSNQLEGNRIIVNDTFPLLDL